MKSFARSSQDGPASAVDQPKNRTGRVAVLNRMDRLLGSRHMPLVLGMAAIVVSLPAIGSGLLNDDYMHHAMLDGHSPYARTLSTVGLAPDGSGRLGYVLSDLYVAVHPQKNLQALRTYGALPWWTYEGYQVAFWRPLTALTYWLDWQLFPRSLALMHVHSIAWFAGVVFVLALLYRRFIGTAWIASLAALLFLIDDSSFFPTMWLANRNLLISLFCCLLAIIAYDHWRREQWQAGALAAPLCLFLSMLAAEAGLTTVAYLFAYEVALGHGRWRRRFSALLPSAVIVVLWRLIYNLQGHGAVGGGFYFDPLGEPVGFVCAVVRRAPFLLAGQWTSIPPELHSLLPPSSATILWLVMLALSVLIPLAMWPFLRSEPRARFWFIGMYLSAMPFCATVPMSRSLLFIAVGAFGLIAEFMVGWLRGSNWLPKPTWQRGTIRNLVVMFILVHVVCGMIGRVMAPHVTVAMGKNVAGTMIPESVEWRPDQDLVIVNAPNPASFLYQPFQRAYKGQSLSRGIRALAPGFNAVEVQRTDERRLVVKSVSKSLFDCQQEKERLDFVFFYRYLSNVRGAAYPLRLGQRVRLPKMTAEVLALDERNSPTEVALTFDVPLEDASLKWLWWDWDHHCYKPFEVPRAGETVRLAGPF